MESSPPTIKERCPGCQFPGGHFASCPDLDIESAKKWIAEYKKLYDRALGRSWHHLRESQRWEGKFRQVKHENNQLRKKLYPKSKVAPVHMEGNSIMESMKRIFIGTPTEKPEDIYGKAKHLSPFEPLPPPKWVKSYDSNGNLLFERNIAGDPPDLPCGPPPDSLFPAPKQAEPPAPPKMVPLGPEDVPQESFIRTAKNDRQHWRKVSSVTCGGLWATDVWFPWENLMNGGYEIQRPGEEWKPCHKPEGGAA